ncbi:SsrA-binding protein SmpB [Candidatus Synchoanobacter obligatus]|uniref:SsrA-binding protein n=1 Tax=Candidatus Synchoanobacter obligatus TaxID=2919597 RepID=A0ABT1L4I2_9GAMM|nr:SsrA-binding protein SmpB [Candidatus Synchoanobacter obligatus]MCP8352075.1 SsrA-binding protein SmpB [Candidatus Synchoanobacter obligatus]
MKKSIKTFATNRKASFLYALETRYEAGLVLQGWEVVAIRQGQINLANSYISIKNSEAYLISAHITPLKTCTSETASPERPRKLLLNRRELSKLTGATAQKGMSIVPLRLYLKSGKLKLEIALAKGKKNYDKKQSLKEKDIQREQLRSLKDFRRNE